jgi:acetyl esterase/lipase
MGKFDNYEILTTDYKVVNGTGIALDVLLPKNLRPGKCPLIIRFHGGGWVSFKPYDGSSKA